MVPFLSVMTISVSTFVCVLLPALVAAALIMGKKASWKSFLVGAAAFFVSQGLIRMPVLYLLNNTAWYSLVTISSPILSIVAIALSAGVFEESGRYIGTRLFLKKELTWRNAVVFGLGHGGMEAFLLTGIGYLGGPGVFQTGYLRALYDIIAGRPDISILNSPSWAFLMGGAERILAICIHIGMSALVLYAVKYRKVQYLIYAILFHGLVDCSWTVLKDLGVSLGIWGTEGLIAAFAVVSLLFAILLRRPLDRDMNTAVESQYK